MAVEASIFPALTSVSICPVPCIKPMGENSTPRARTFKGVFLNGTVPPTSIFVARFLFSIFVIASAREFASWKVERFASLMA